MDLNFAIIVDLSLIWALPRMIIIERTLCLARQCCLYCMKVCILCFNCGRPHIMPGNKELTSTITMFGMSCDAALKPPTLQKSATLPPDP